MDDKDRTLWALCAVHQRAERHVLTRHWHGASALEGECLPVVADPEVQAAWPCLTGEAYCMLGVCYTNTGQHAKALEMHTMYRGIMEEAGLVAHVGRACCHMGKCQRKLGRLETAAVLFERARAIAREVGHAKVASKACSYLGIVFRAQGENARALEMFEQGRVLAAAGGPRALTHGSHILDHDDDEDFDLHEQRVLEDLRCCAQRKMEAFAGGLHPRLGHDSVVLSLREHALLQMIADEVLGDSLGRMWVPVKSATVGRPDDRGTRHDN